jgi:hypothetical protein
MNEPDGYPIKELGYDKTVSASAFLKKNCHK